MIVLGLENTKGIFHDTVVVTFPFLRHNLPNPLIIFFGIAVFSFTCFVGVQLLDCNIEWWFSFDK